MVFYAGIEMFNANDNTKTILDGSPADEFRSIMWQPEDKVYVTNGNSSSKFINTQEDNSTFAYFEGELSEGEDFYAAYPFDIVNSYGENGFNVTIPSVQPYYTDGVAPGYFPMVAQYNGEILNFKNLCGVLVLQLLGNHTITQIAFTGKNAEGSAIPVSGKGVVPMDYIDNPSLTLNVDAHTSVKLDCSSGVKLSEIVPTTFHIVIPPGTYTTFELLIEADNQSLMSVKSEKTLIIKRSKRTTATAITYEETYGLIDYIDEYGINHGKGTKIDGVVWAPVNCGYKKPTDESKGFPYGKLYQWGRKYGQGYSASYDESTPTIKAGPVSLATGQSSSNKNVFYQCQKAPFNWSTTRDDNMWYNDSYNPCPNGWRVPTADELGSLDDNKSSWTTHENKTGYWFSGSNAYSEDVSAVFLPAAGQRYYCVDSYNGGPYSRESGGYYWSSKSLYYYSGSSSYWTGAYVLHFNETESSIEGSKRYRAYGYSIRCVQEDTIPTIPESPKEEYVNLSADATANCYIVSEPGKYKLYATIKGNSTETIGDVDAAEVLWESFGTDVPPSVGDIVRNVSYKDSYIEFETSSPLTEGNAVIAAKDASGTILWSWHIWVTDQPEEQVYYNNAGTMMDRNLGATSATPGDIGALGLLYQWGRKDPFLATSSIENFAEVASTGAWSQVSTSSSVGTVVHTIQNPTQFIVNPTAECGDWHYANRNNELWSVSKTIYDPCPKGWRVPENVWATLKGVQSFHSFLISGDINNKGFNFFNDFGNDSIIWYPSVMWREYSDGGNHDGGSYWTSITNDTYAFDMLISFIPESYHINGTWQRAAGKSIRCQKE